MQNHCFIIHSHKAARALLGEPEESASERSRSTPSTNDDFSEDLMIASSERLKNADIRPFFKIISRHKF